MSKEFDNIHLSKESLALLKHFADVEEIPSNQSSENPCFDQLCEYGLIETHIIDYTDDEFPQPIYSPYRIAELGKGYLHTLKSEDEFKKSIRAMANSAENIAKSAKQQSDAATKQADIAFKVAKKADIKGWIASIAAAILTIIEAIDHLDVILSLFQSFIH
ncbi:MAG: hypothetical protein HFI88_10075 [Lachnospiraceae bacterium]|nr:hypothetical protein [Lachnospiraceae bacterium]